MSSTPEIGASVMVGCDVSWTGDGVRESAMRGSARGGKTYDIVHGQGIGMGVVVVVVVEMWRHEEKVASRAALAPSHLPRRTARSHKSHTGSSKNVPCNAGPLGPKLEAPTGKAPTKPDATPPQTQHQKPVQRPG
jgi:hypothetical protein